MKANKIKMTSHAKDDRADRLTYIAINVGFGEVVLEHINADNRRDCITDTGVLLIKNATEEILITAYIPTVDKVSAIYKSAGFDCVPQHIYRIAKKNEKKHLKMQNIVKY